MCVCTRATTTDTDTCALLLHELVHHVADIDLLFIVGCCNLLHTLNLLVVETLAEILHEVLELGQRDVTGSHTHKYEIA